MIRAMRVCAAICIFAHLVPSTGWTLPHDNTLAVQCRYKDSLAGSVSECHFIEATLKYCVCKNPRFLESTTDRAIRPGDNPRFNTILFQFTKKQSHSSTSFSIPVILNRNERYIVTINCPPDSPGTYTVLGIEPGNDVNIADIGRIAKDHQALNAKITELSKRGIDTVTIAGFEEFTVNVIGNEHDMYIDRETQQRAHAGGISRIGTDNAEKRLWIARGTYEKNRDEAILRIMHEAIELNCWWAKTQKLLKKRKIRTAGNKNSNLPTIREWMKENRNLAESLYDEYHNEAKKRCVAFKEQRKQDKTFASKFLKFGENRYYLYKYFFEQIAGLRFNAHTVEDFKHEALAAGSVGLRKYYIFAQHANLQAYLQQVIDTRLMAFSYMEIKKWKALSRALIRSMSSEIEKNSGPNKSFTLAREDVIANIAKRYPNIFAFVYKLRHQTARNTEGQALAEHNSARPPNDYSIMDDITEIVGQVLETLPYREREIIKLLNGLGDGYCYTLEEVAKIFEVTKSRIGQIEKEVMKRLQHPKQMKQLAQKAHMLLVDIGQGDTSRLAEIGRLKKRITADDFPDPIPRRYRRRKKPFSIADEDAILNWVDQRVPREQQALIPLFLKGLTDQEILEGDGISAGILTTVLERHKKPLITKLTQWCTLGVFDKFGSPDEVKEILINLFSEKPIDRFIRRHGVRKLIEVSGGDRAVIEELLLHVMPEKFKGMDAVLEGSFSEIFPKGAQGKRQALEPQYVLSAVRDFVGKLDPSVAERKKIVLKRLLRDFYYPFMRKDEETEQEEGIHFLREEVRNVQADTVWVEIVREVYEEYKAARKFKPRGFRKKVEGRKRQEPLLPFQRYSVYQALKTLEDPKENCSWFASDARTGKSITAALSAFNIKKSDGSYAVRKLLITTPNAAKYEFAGELTRRISQDLDLKVFVVDSEMGNRGEQILEASAASKKGENVVLIANYEAVTDCAESITTEFNPDCHIIDEIENLRHAYKEKAVRAPVIFGIPAEYRIGMSARPVVKKPTDIIEALMWMRHKTLVPSDRRIADVRAGLRKVGLDELFQMLDPVFVRWRRNIVLPELQRITETTEWLPYSETQEDMIGGMRDNFIMWKQRHARSDKVTNAEGIFACFDLERRASVDLRLVARPEETAGLSDAELAPKLIRLDRIIDSEIKTNGKVVVLVDFVEEVDRLIDRYTERLGGGEVIGIHGGIPVKERNAGIQDFRSRGKPKVLIGTTALLGSSLNLFQMQGSPFHISTLVRLSRPWENYDDGERLVGIGQTHPVSVITLASYSKNFDSTEVRLQKRLEEERQFSMHIVEGTPILDEDTRATVEKFMVDALERTPTKGIVTGPIKPKKAVEPDGIRKLQDRIHDKNMALTPAIPHGKVLWHVLAGEVIPDMQHDMGLVTKLNQSFARSDMPEKIRIIPRGGDMTAELAALQKNPNNIVHVILHDEQGIDQIPEGVKAAIVKGELGNYRHVEGVLAVSRALDIEDVDLRNKTLRSLYLMLTGKKFTGTLPHSDDAKALALSIIFELPKIVIQDYERLKVLNNRLLLLIRSA